LDISNLFFKYLLYLPVSQIQAGPVLQYIKLLKLSQYSSRLSLEEIQIEKLKSLVSYASKNNPYFSEILSQLELPENENIDILIQQLPFLDKHSIQKSNSELISNRKFTNNISKTTGGSTGEPVTIIKSRSSLAWELAATWRGYSWAGIDVGNRQGRFWGLPQTKTGVLKSKAIDFVCNRTRISAFAFSDDHMLRYYYLLNNKKPQYLYGYVSMLTEFAKFLMANELELDFPITCVISTAEVLSGSDRKLMQSVFQAPVFNEYGCGELGTIAHECEHGNMHISEENMYVEIVNNSTQSIEGEPGEIVVTELNNFAFPLIRYRTGDYGIISKTPCPCGKTLHVLKEIQGRAYDFLRNKSGKKFHSEILMYLFESLHQKGSYIKQFQIIQDKLDHFTVRIIKGINFDNNLEMLITSKIREQIESDAIVDFEYVDNIDREKSGKMRVIVGMKDNQA
jgi:phenylacetate-CoA ligase